MPTAPPPSPDVALETRVFWDRFKKQIIAALLIVLIAVIAFVGYRLYSDHRAAAASALLASAKTAQEYQQLIDRYPSTPAAAAAYLLLAKAQQNEKKFAEANTTLQSFIAKYPQHELVSTARMAMAANLESMGKADEALAIYQQVASAAPKDFNAPMALLSQVYILKAKNRNDDARKIGETVLTQYRTSFWAGEAMQQLQMLKPITLSTPAPAIAPTVPPMLSVPGAAAPAPATPPPAPADAKCPRRGGPRAASSACAEQAAVRATAAAETLAPADGKCSAQGGSPHGESVCGPVAGPGISNGLKLSRRPTKAVATAAALSFRELETFPRTGLTGFFALFHAGIAAKQTLGLQQATQIGICLEKSPRYGQLRGARLSHNAAAGGINPQIVSVHCLGRLKRLQDNVL